VVSPHLPVKFVSEEILEEYSASCVVQSLSAFRAAAVLVNPRIQIVAARDPDDDKTLECAMEAKADYIVTGRIRDFAEQFRGVSVLPPRGPERPCLSHQPLVSPVVRCGFAE
jgi:hypothetical protein